MAETDPDLVFIGMGETCIRGNILPGDGVYRSRDAGATWEHVGFSESHGISTIRIHPTDPAIVYVASFGKYGVPSEERGVFKSTDGGDTWERILFRDERTGAIDIAIDRNNPDVIYAALWQAFRKEYTMSSGGPGSGMFKSVDGGATWTEITRNPGMPAGRRRRQDRPGGVDRELGPRLRPLRARRRRPLPLGRRRRQLGAHQRRAADPAAGVLLHARVRRPSRPGRGVRAEHVLLPLDRRRRDVRSHQQRDTRRLPRLLDRPRRPRARRGRQRRRRRGQLHHPGSEWTDQEFSTAQFYHGVTTAHIPWHICGSQQDNSTLCLPSDWNRARFESALADTADDSGARVPAITRGSMNVHYRAGGGEPGYIAPDPKDLDVFFSGTNNGRYLDRYNRRLGTSREVNPYPWFYSGEPAVDMLERWQWTFPIIFSPIDPNVLYTSSNRLWRTTDGGDSWERLSDDLTRADPMTLGHSGGPITGDMNGPEVYATIFAVGPGKVDIDVIWTGSDDGLVHVTRDGGGSWKNVTRRRTCRSSGGSA